MLLPFFHMSNILEPFRKCSSAFSLHPAQLAGSVPKKFDKSILIYLLNTYLSGNLLWFCPPGCPDVETLLDMAHHISSVSARSRVQLSSSSETQHS